MDEQNLGLSGLLVCRVITPDPDKVILEGIDQDLVDFRQMDNGLWKSDTFTRKNAFVNVGLNAALDRLFGLTSVDAQTVVASAIGVSSDNTAVTAATTSLGGTTSIKAFSPAASRTGQTVTAGATFTQTDVAFSIRKVGLLKATTETATTLIDVIGGSGSSPYNQPFTIDLTGTTSFSLLMQVQVTAQAI